MKQFIYRINGQDYIVAVNKLENSIAQVAVNGTNYEIELVNNEEQDIKIAARPSAPKAAASTAPKAAAAPVANKSAGNSNAAGAVNSPLPGVIVSIDVNVGDTVKKGQQVAILEAMKMENVINSPVDGTVASINVNKGDSILEGVTILTIG